MPSPSSRVLRLLSLLQVRRDWSGAELSQRLGVDVRTIRRDVDRLRELGYTIDASSGVGGGYRLGAGAETPPLLLEDDEAVAVAVALGVAAGGAGATQEVALRVLAKLDQLLPRRLRRKLTSVPAVTISLVDPGSAASLSVLATIASACRDMVQLKFSYRDMRGNVSARITEPMRLVHTGRHWYLAAWDVTRGDWRTFRVDRIESAPRLTQGPRFVSRQPPEDFATMVRKAITSWPQPVHVRLKVKGTPAEVRRQVPEWVGDVAASDEGHTVLTINAESPNMVAALMLVANIDFALLGPAAMAQPIRESTERMLSNLAGRSRRYNRRASS
jgi:predicted DNA-binding transcriptional regulator YafY